MEISTNVWNDRFGMATPPLSPNDSPNLVTKPGFCKRPGSRFGLLEMLVKAAVLVQVFIPWAPKTYMFQGFYGK